MNELPNFNFRVVNENCKDPQLYTRIVLTINSKEVVLAIAKNKLFAFLDSMKDIFDDLRQEGNYFNTDELTKRIMAKGAVQRKYIAEVAASSIIRMIDRIDAKLFNAVSFVDYNSQTGRFRIKNTTYENRIYAIKKCANIFLANSVDHETTRYVSKTDATEIVICQLLELLGAAECDMLSGTNPEFFIRVNNPYAIERIINNPNYVSRTVALVVGQKTKVMRFYELLFYKTIHRHRTLGNL
jgi:acetolactate synthase small subunit